MVEVVGYFAVVGGFLKLGTQKMGGLLQQVVSIG